MSGLDKTSQQGWRFGQPSENPSAHRAEVPLELRALDGAAGERDRALVGARGRRRVARAAERLGVRGLKRLVAGGGGDRRPPDWPEARRAATP
jgi:hypothetical protein